MIIKIKQKMAAYMELSRLSNLPTVWTNAIVGMTISSGFLKNPLFLLAGFSLFYISGMFLNDASDWEKDSKERPSRPVPKGAVSLKEVYITGFILLLGANFLILYEAFRTNNKSMYIVLLYSLLLSFAIVSYNFCYTNKTPLLMGICRALIYIISAQIGSKVLKMEVWIISAVFIFYIMGLTYIAKQETKTRLRYKSGFIFILFPLIYALFKVNFLSFTIVIFLLFLAILVFVLYNTLKNNFSIQTTVIFLISAISIWDALLLSINGFFTLSILAVICFFLTLFFNKFIKGT